MKICAAQHANRTAGGLIQTCQDPYQSSLPGTIVAENGINAPGFERSIHPT
jgi:hypothetical protein